MDATRREFLSTTTKITGCLALGTGLSSCGIGGLLYTSKDIPVQTGTAAIDIVSETVLQTVGGAVKKRFEGVNGGAVIVVVRIGENEFRAFAAQCTHWGAEVDLPGRTGIMVCPFHGSRFSTADGHVVEGPARHTLLSLHVTLDEEKHLLTLRDIPSSTEQ